MVAARRALAGLEPGGHSGRLAARFAPVLAAPRRPPRRAPYKVFLGAERAQALPAVLGIAMLIVALALILVAFGGAATAKGRLQRAADLAAISAARRCATTSRGSSCRRAFPTEPRTRLTSNAPSTWIAPGPWAATRPSATAWTRASSTSSFPDGGSFAPLRVTVGIEAEIELERTERRAEGRDATSMRRPR